MSNARILAFNVGAALCAGLGIAGAADVPGTQPSTRPAEARSWEQRAFPADAFEAMNRHASDVKAEAEQVGTPDWAGVYYKGDGLGANDSLSLAPTAGMAYTSYGCLGLYGMNYGAVATDPADASVIELRPALSGKDAGSYSVPDRLRVVKWGERRYLIAATDPAGLINEINIGTEPRAAMQGQVFLMQGDEQRPAPGVPNLPAEWTSRILKKPLAATIESQRTADDGRTTYRLPIGRSSGVWVGQAFFVIEGNEFERLTVTSVDDSSSELSPAWVGNRAGPTLEGKRAATTYRSTR